MNRLQLASRAAGRRAFTLVEIMLVIVIMMSLAAVVIPQISGKAKRARVSTTKIQMEHIKTAMQEFEMNADRFPTKDEGLKALVERPSGLTKDQWPDKYMPEIPKDAWGQEFTYTWPSEHGKDYDLLSAGPDRQAGTDDDITNYKTDADKSASSK